MIYTSCLLNLSQQHNIIFFIAKRICQLDLKPKNIQCYLNSMPSLHNLIAPPFGDLCNDNLIYICTHEGMATNWNECYKSKTMTKLVESYKCNKQWTNKGEEIQPYHDCKPNVALDDSPYVFIMKDMHVNNKKNMKKMVTYTFFYLKRMLQTFHHCWVLVISWGFFHFFSLFHSHDGSLV